MGRPVAMYEDMNARQREMQPQQEGAKIGHDGDKKFGERLTQQVSRPRAAEHRLDEVRDVPVLEKIVPARRNENRLRAFARPR